MATLLLMGEAANVIIDPPGAHDESGQDGRVRARCVKHKVSTVRPDGLSCRWTQLYPNTVIAINTAEAHADVGRV